MQQLLKMQQNTWLDITHIKDIYNLSWAHENSGREAGLQPA